MTLAASLSTVAGVKAGAVPSTASGRSARWTLAGVALLVSQACFGAVDDLARPELLAEAFVAAVVSRDSQRQLSLVHPLSRACLNEQTRPYFEWIFSKRARLVTGRPVKVTVTPIDRVATALPTDGQSDYPLRPSHQVQLDFESGPYKRSSVIVYVVYDGSRWLDVLPCPRGDVAAQARRNQAAQQHFVRLGMSHLPEPLMRFALGSLLACADGIIDAIRPSRMTTVVSCNDSLSGVIGSTVTCSMTSGDSSAAETAPARPMNTTARATNIQANWAGGQGS
jgi:hypothetical protein